MEIHITYKQRHTTAHADSQNEDHANGSSDSFSHSCDPRKHKTSSGVHDPAAHSWWPGVPLLMRAAALGILTGAVLGVATVLALSLLQHGSSLDSEQLVQGAALGAVVSACGLDGMKVYILSARAEDGPDAHVYGSCHLCGLSADAVHRMLALPHDCQRDVWEEEHWVPLDSMWQSARQETPTCIVICSSLIPCSPPESDNNSSQPSSQALPSCLLSMWVRKGTSDAEVAFQIYFDTKANSMALLGLPSPQQLPIHTILDAGANIGLMSLYFATLYPGAMIVSMEASSSNYDLLVLNTARFHNIRPLHRALWSSTTTLCLVHGKRNIPIELKPEWMYQVMEKDMVPEGRVVLDSILSNSVPDVLHTFGLQSFDLIKIDVEGSEGAVFAEGSDVSFLEHAQMVIMELHGDMWEGAPAIVQSAFERYPRWRLASRRGEHELWLADKEQTLQGGKARVPSAKGATEHSQ